MNQGMTRKVFIKAGEPIAMLGGGDDRCYRDGNALVVLPDEHWGNPVFAETSLNPGDFHIHAMLTLDRLAGDGASILLGGQYDEHWTRPEGNHAFRICLDEDYNPPFKSLAKQMRIVYGKTEPLRSWFPADGVTGKREAGVSSDFFRPGAPFTIDLSRQGKMLVFSINEREVFRADVLDEGPVSPRGLDAPDGPLNFGFLPGRGTLRIQEFWAEGSFPEQAFPATDVWRLNAEGYAHYRTPALCRTAGGKLIAFSEARRSYLSRGWEWEKIQEIEMLSGDIHCAMKHSDDNGRTWSAQSIVIDRGSTYDARFPAPLLDRDTGELFLFMNGSWLLSSRDEGRTWSGPHSLNGALPGNWKSGNFKSLNPGVANSGIQLRHGRFKGRLLMAFHSPGLKGSRITSVVALVLSDDHGKTWQPGALAPFYMAINSSLVELADGRVIVSPQVGPRIGQPPAGRPFLISHDGGSSFAETRCEPLLPASGQAAMLAVDLPDTGAAANVRPIVFCGASEGGVRLTLSVSLDDGATWPLSKVIDEGSVGNLALAALPGGKVGVLYERDQYRRIIYQCVELASMIRER